MGEDVILEIKNLTKKFGHKKIIENINLEIKKGEILGIVGGSGQGKSVLIKNIIGFFKPSKGKIITKTKKINFSMQDNSLYEYLTVKQNWKHFARINGIKRKERKKKIKELLEKLTLREYKGTLVKKLSGGTKKRVDIGCALMTNPEIIILDEPFTGLDKNLVKHLARFILYLNKEGKTIILISHRIKLMSKICSKIMLLENKKLIETTPKKILEEYNDLE